jgi:tRNA nucleotidyltransferase (CCA-adding enzyme)
MASDSTPQPSPDFGQTLPGLGLLRMASLLAETAAEPGEEELILMADQVKAGVFSDAAPSEIWPELALGLMSRQPAKMLAILRACGALEQILPEVAALFGVPDLSEGQAEVDLGEHMLCALAEAVLSGAPLEVRFALLVKNVGKADSPPEHLPSHYKHIERGRPRIEAICARFAAPPDCRDLALLALAECERVHRVSKMRAGPVALMLDRLGAFTTPERFSALMTLCACDFCAHDGRSGQAYPKAALLHIALRACADLDKTDTGEEAQTARAEAIARAFRSERWSDEVG